MWEHYTSRGIEMVTMFRGAYIWTLFFSMAFGLILGLVIADAKKRK